MGDKKERRSLAAFFQGKKFRGYHPREDAEAVDESNPPKGGSGFVLVKTESKSQTEDESEESKKPS